MVNRDKKKDLVSLLKAISSSMITHIRSTFKKSIKLDIILMVRRRKSHRTKQMINFHIKSQKRHIVNMM